MIVGNFPATRVVQYALHYAILPYLIFQLASGVYDVPYCTLDPAREQHAHSRHVLQSRAISHSLQSRNRASLPVWAYHQTPIPSLRRRPYFNPAHSCHSSHPSHSCPVPAPGPALVLVGPAAADLAAAASSSY
jgi:hypothetical protein